MTTAFYKRGFTLVETLVAISVLVVVIVGPMTLAAKGLQNAYHAREQLAATYLAQEGFEIVRAVRDSYTLDSGGPEWVARVDSARLHPTCWDPGYDGCALDSRRPSASEFTFRPCTLDNFNDPNEIACEIEMTPALGGTRGQFFLATTRSATHFRRRVLVREIASPTLNKEVEVTVIVGWKSSAFSGAPKEVVLKGRIFDQYDNL